MTQNPDRRTVLKTVGSAGVLLAAGIGSVGAQGDHSNSTQGNDSNSTQADDAKGAQGDDAKIRAAHAVPDAPAVDVLVDGDVVVEELAFGEVTGYLEVPAGEYDLALNDAGTDDTVFEATVELAAVDYTAAAIGNLSPECDEPELTVDVFEDKLGALDDGEGRVRVYHASPDAPAVDVAVADENDEPAQFLAQGLAFGDAAPNVEVPAGTYPVAVYPADCGTPVFGPVDVEIRDGEVLTAVAAGELEPEGDEPGFTPVLAYEAAAPSGGDRS